MLENMTFKDILREMDLEEDKTIIKLNKGIKIYFYNVSGHAMSDKIERANISDAEFKKSLNKMTAAIKKNKLDTGTYGFVFKNFKVPVSYDANKKELVVKTILNKSMKMSDVDQTFEL